MAFVKFLNGDLLSVEMLPTWTTVDVNTYLTMNVARHCNVYPSQVHLYQEEEEKGKDGKEEKAGNDTYMVWIRPKPIVKLMYYGRFPTWNYQCDYLVDAVNESILTTYLKSFSEFQHHILANPHPMVVTYILENFTSISRKFHCRSLFSNPADAVVDIVLESIKSGKIPFHIDARMGLREVFANTNPRMVEYLITYQTHQIPIAMFLKSSNDRAVQCALWKMHELTLPVFHSHIISMIDSLNSNLSNVPNPVIVTFLLNHMKTPEGFSSYYVQLLNAGIRCEGSHELAEWVVSQLEKQKAQTGAFQQFHIPVEIFANSNQVVVDYLLRNWEEVISDKRGHKMLARNSHPDIFERVSTIDTMFPDLLRNGNPVAIEQSKKWLSAYTGGVFSVEVMDALLSNPRADLLIHILSDTNCIPLVVWHSTDMYRRAEAMLSRTEEVEVIIEPLLRNHE